MKFLFQPNQSKILDFLRFPKFLYQKEVFMQKSNPAYKEAIDESYIEAMERYKTLLTPYQKEIDFFYRHDFLEFDFIDCFRSAIALHSFKTARDFLNYLSTLEDNQIKYELITTLNAQNEDETKKLSPNASQEAFRVFLESYDIEPTVKWSLLLIMAEPQKYMRRYLGLMDALEPIFEEVYKPFEQEVIAYGYELAAYLNEHGEEGLNKRTYSLIDKTYFISDTSYLLISALFAYALIVTDSTNEVLWGLKSEQAFKRISEIKKDKFHERVQCFKNLGDKTKYEVLKYVSQGITSTKELARLTDVSSATISYHINAFLTSKVITLDNTNKKFSYVINYALLNDMWEDLKVDLKFPQL